MTPPPAVEDITPQKIQTPPHHRGSRQCPTANAIRRSNPSDAHRNRRADGGTTNPIRLTLGVDHCPPKRLGAVVPGEQAWSQRGSDR